MQWLNTIFLLLIIILYSTTKSYSRINYDIIDNDKKMEINTSVHGNSSKYDDDFRQRFLYPNDQNFIKQIHRDVKNVMSGLPRFAKNISDIYDGVTKLRECFDDHLNNSGANEEISVLANNTHEIMESVGGVKRKIDTIERMLHTLIFNITTNISGLYENVRGNYDEYQELSTNLSDVSQRINDAHSLWPSMKNYMNASDTKLQLITTSQDRIRSILLQQGHQILSELGKVSQKIDMTVLNVNTESSKMHNELLNFVLTISNQVLDLRRMIEMQVIGIPGSSNDRLHSSRDPSIHHSSNEISLNLTSGSSSANVGFSRLPINYAPSINSMLPGLYSYRDPNHLKTPSMAIGGVAGSGKIQGIPGIPNDITGSFGGIGGFIFFPSIDNPLSLPSSPGIRPPPADTTKPGKPGFPEYPLFSEYPSYPNQPTTSTPYNLSPNFFQMQRNPSLYMPYPSYPSYPPYPSYPTFPTHPLQQSPIPGIPIPGIPGSAYPSGPIDGPAPSNGQPYPGQPSTSTSYSRPTWSPSVPPTQTTATSYPGRPTRPGSFPGRPPARPPSYPGMPQLRPPSYPSQPDEPPYPDEYPPLQPNFPPQYPGRPPPEPPQYPPTTQSQYPQRPDNLYPEQFPERPPYPGQPVTPSYPGYPSNGRPATRPTHSPTRPSSLSEPILIPPGIPLGDGPYQGSCVCICPCECTCATVPSEWLPTKTTTTTTTYPSPINHPQWATDYSQPYWHSARNRCNCLCSCPCPSPSPGVTSQRPGIYTTLSYFEDYGVNGNDMWQPSYPSQGGRPPLDRPHMRPPSDIRPNQQNATLLKELITIKNDIATIKNEMSLARATIIGQMNTKIDEMKYYLSDMHHLNIAHFNENKNVTDAINKNVKNSFEQALFMLNTISSYAASTSNEIEQLVAHVKYQQQVLPNMPNMPNMPNIPNVPNYPGYQSKIKSNYSEFWHENPIGGKPKRIDSNKTKAGLRRNIETESPKIPPINSKLKKIYRNNTDKYQCKDNQVPIINNKTKSAINRSQQYPLNNSKSNCNKGNNEDDDYFADDDNNSSEEVDSQEMDSEESDNSSEEDDIPRIAMQKIPIGNFNFQKLLMKPFINHQRPGLIPKPFPYPPPLPLPHFPFINSMLPPLVQHLRPHIPLYPPPLPPPPPIIPMIHNLNSIFSHYGFRPPTRQLPIPLPTKKVRLNSMLPFDILQNLPKLPKEVLEAATAGKPFSASYNDGQGNQWNINVNRRHLRGSRIDMVDSDENDDTSDESTKD